MTENIKLLNAINELSECIKNLSIILDNKEKPEEEIKKEDNTENIKTELINQIKNQIRTNKTNRDEVKKLINQISENSSIYDLTTEQVHTLLEKLNK